MPSDSEGTPKRPRSNAVELIPDGHEPAPPDPELALQRWSQRVAAASAELVGAYTSLSDLEQRVIASVHNAAVNLRLARDGLADETDRQRLEMLAFGWERQSDTARLATALRRVRECAERQVPRLRKVSPEGVDWETLLLQILAAEVHPNFGALLIRHELPTDALGRPGFAIFEAKTEVRELLRKYTNTKDRRSKLAAPGIVVELNRMAGFPLGRSLTTTKVTNAANTKRANRRKGV